MKVFISSTYADLIEYRKSAIETVNRFKCVPLAMELFMAKPQEPRNACEKEIDECDIFVGIYAHRYGFVPNGQEKSIIHLEYKLGKTLKKDYLYFVVKQDYPWKPKLIEEKKNRAKLQNFITLIKNDNTVVLFESPKDFESKLAASLGKLLLEKQAGQSYAAAGAASPYMAHPYPLSEHFTGRVERQFKGRKYSLIMGIENYPEISGQTKVSYASNDAKAMADYAREAGFQLIDGKPLLDGEATYKKVIDKLGYLFHMADADDFILLYFAGHGFYSEDGGYLIPFDYQKENAINESSCISFDSINKRFKNKKTRHFIFFLDTCHSGYAGKQMDIRGAEPGSRDIHITHEAGEKVKSEMEAMLHKGEISQGVGRLVFTSSGLTEKSHHTDDFQHGLFTYYLLSCLKSKANEKQVNVEDLVRSVKDNVIAFCVGKNWVQTPTSYSNIQGDFFLPAYETQPRPGQFVYAPDFSLDIRKARKALQSEDFDAAAQIINTILQKDRLNFEANLLSEEVDNGRNLQILKEKTEIRRHYEEWLRRGEKFKKEGGFSKARECFDNAAKIFPDSQMAQSYIKEIDTRQQITKVDDIEVPAGDKAVILKNLFQAAIDAFNAGEFTTVLNHYNKILKTYPGNQRAIKEKKQLFEKWLQQYKDSARYLEMLGLFENIILPDESLRDDHIRFEEEYNETVLLYTQVFLKSRISTEIEPMIKEIENKRKRLDSFEKVLKEYHDLAMDAEYNEFLKITDKIKSELDHISGQIKLKSEIIETKDILKTEEKALSDYILTILESLINEGITDKYILIANEQIVSEKARLQIDKVIKMPEKDSNQISKKCEAFNEFQKKYPGKLTHKINSELTRLNFVLEKIIAEKTQAELDRIKTMPEKDRYHIFKRREKAIIKISEKIKAFNEFRKKYSGELTEEINSELTRLNQAEFDRIKTMPETNSFQISAKTIAFNEFQKKDLGELTEEINSELTRLNQAEFDRIKTMPETNSFQISRKIKAFNEFQKEYPGKLIHNINSELKRLNIVHEKIIAEETQTEFARIKTMPETNSYQISAKIKAFNEFQKKYPGKLTEEINSARTRLNSALEIKIIAEETQTEFARIKTMPETNSSQISEKIKAFNEFQKKDLGKLTEEINRELMRLNLFLDIVEIFGMQVKTVKEYKTKLKLLKQIDQSKYNLLKNNITSEIVSVESKLKEQENVLWNRRYKIFDIFSLSLYTLLNLIIYIIVTIHFFKKEGFFNILGNIVGWIILLSIIKILFFPGREGYSIKISGKKTELFFRELGKIGATSSLPITCYINMVRNPETFFNWTLILALVLLSISFECLYKADNENNINKTIGPKNWGPNWDP